MYNHTFSILFTIENKTYVIGAIYRHTNQNISDFTKLLDITLNKLSSKKLSCIIAGDINIDLAKCNDHSDTAEYSNNLLMHNFMPMIVMPTRITGRSATIIDHIYYYEGRNLTKNYQVKSSNLINDLTDHLPNYMIVTRSKSIQLKERPLVCIFSEKNTQNFIRGMQSADMSDIHCESKKGTSVFLSITLAHINRFSNFFHCCIWQ